MQHWFTRDKHKVIGAFLLGKLVLTLTLRIYATVSYFRCGLVISHLCTVIEYFGKFYLWCFTCQIKKYCFVSSTRNIKCSLISSSSNTFLHHLVHFGIWGLKICYGFWAFSEPYTLSSENEIHFCVLIYTCRHTLLQDCINLTKFFSVNIFYICRWNRQ
jgi:hypothetical protein